MTKKTRYFYFWWQFFEVLKREIFFIVITEKENELREICYKALWSGKMNRWKRSNPYIIKRYIIVQRCGCYLYENWKLGSNLVLTWDDAWPYSVRQPSSSYFIVPRRAVYVNAAISFVYNLWTITYALSRCTWTMDSGCALLSAQIYQHTLHSCVRVMCMNRKSTWPSLLSLHPEFTAEKEIKFSALIPLVEMLPFWIFSRIFFNERQYRF